ncbi:SDR family oxidoreductase [Afifella sp. JA880]|uniref:UDP-glucuronic acid decarboxylase family protein n=1 Tax=Afifella sp. JA880 TaxID=2975280 RepID=UPI0021BB893A|nr:UDP-glucuronic acid decarboxylase family protein [Afifella sp. JA880]MCT8266288.1 SDR family oxidoreductase [Afifella sp. JA880]
MRRKPRILIAGGAGFIGSHLSEALLAEGHEVLCLDSLLTGKTENVDRLARDPKFHFLRQDIIDPLPLSVRADFVCNLACAASPPHYQADPVHTMLTSVMGTRNLLASANEQGAGFLLASTSEVYGDPEIHPQPESYLGNVNSTGPRACYDEGKRAAEALAFDFRRTRQTDVRVVRIFNTYGPRMRPDDGRVVSNVICQALTNADITIYGSGQQTRSFCYVDDLVDGLMRMIGLPAAPERPINLGSPFEFTIRELVDEVLALTGSRSRIIEKPLPVDDPKRRQPDIAQARALLGWEPKVRLETGLRYTADWFAEALGSEKKPSRSCGAAPMVAEANGMVMPGAPPTR